MFELFCIRCKYIRRDKQTRNPMIASFFLNILFVIFFLIILIGSNIYLGDDMNIKIDYHSVTNSFKQNKNPII